MKEIQKADPRARRQALWAAAVAAVAGAVVIITFGSYGQRLEDLAASDPGQALVRVGLIMKVLAAALAVTMVGFSAYLYRFGQRISGAPG
jgi:hypothetical protein